MCNINSTNSLKHLLDDFDEEFDTISASTYFDVDSLADLMSSNNSNFSILSLTLYDPGGGGALKAPPPSDICSHAFNFGAVLLCVGDFFQKIVWQLFDKSKSCQS